MPIVPVLGPVSGGKSQFVDREREDGDVTIDFTALFAALASVQRGADGRYPERTDGDPRLPFVQAVKNFALTEAIRRELNGHVTSSARHDVEPLQVRTGQEAVIIDPGRDVIEDRLRDPETGEISDECRKALERWYR